MNNQGAVNQAIGQAKSQGAALQGQYNQQAAQQYGAYQGAQNQANSGYNQLQAYTNQIAGQNYGNLYNQALQGYNTQYGVNPQTIQNLQNQIGQNAATLAYLPQAIQQQGNYYGTTAGSEANNYAAMSNQLSNQGQFANAKLNAQLGFVNAAQGAANQQTTQQLAGQQQTLSGYQSLYQNAVSQMQATGQTLAQIEALQQQQGFLTSEQVNQYQSAYNGYISAQAAAENASAAMTVAVPQAQQYGLQNVGLQNQLNAAAAQAAAKARPAQTAPRPAAKPASQGINLRSVLGNF